VNQTFSKWPQPVCRGRLTLWTDFETGRAGPEMKKLTIKKAIISMGLVCWFILMFFMSSDMDSSQKTYVVSQDIQKTATELLQNSSQPSHISVKELNYSIRKAGHFIEYLVLCLFLLKLRDIYKLQSRISIIEVLFICLLVANLDEFYQSFIIGRNSRVSDSLIDFCGSMTGLAIYESVQWFSKKKL
jgi:VanZ family protein